MSDRFVVGVDLDFRNPKIGFDMGLHKLLDASDIDVRFYSTERANEAIPREFLGDVDAFILVERTLNGDSLTDAKNLKWVGRFGAGFDNVDVSACTEKGILVSNSPQGVWISVPEIVLGYMLALVNRFKELDSYVREYGFHGKSQIAIRCLSGRTVGIVGFGGTGSGIARLCGAFGMKVIAFDPYADDAVVAASGAKRVDLEELFKTSDFVSINVPLTAKTKGMVGEAELRMMKKEAFLINTSRGHVCSDSAIARAVRENWIAGAAVDVFENEPNVEANPLVNTESHNVILTPHVAGANNVDAMTMVGETLSECVLRIKQGEWPLNILNPEATREKIPSDCLTPSFIGKSG